MEDQHKNEKRIKLLHHIATAIGFIWLLAWAYMLNHNGVFEWGGRIMPQGYEGAGVMLAIGISMVPGLFIWNQYNKFVEKKLGIKGKYYEEDFYKDEEKE